MPKSTVCACPYCKSDNLVKSTKRDTDGAEIFVGTFAPGDGMQVFNDGIKQFVCQGCSAVFYAEPNQSLSR